MSNVGAGGARIASEISIGHLAETIAAGMLRAVSSHEEFRQITELPDGGVIVRPLITAGGWIYIVKNAKAFAVSGPEVSV